MAKLLALVGICGSALAIVGGSVLLTLLAAGVVAIAKVMRVRCR